MKNKILITINNLDDIEYYQKLGLKHFVYPLKDFCVGMPNVFSVAEIKEEGYLFLNRICDNEAIDDLKKIIKKLPNNIKGIIFDDLGVLEIVKDLKIEKILFLNHFNTNTLSIKIYLAHVDSVVISSDITKEEMQVIVDNIPNKLTIFVLGYVNAMYSRRLLIDNYCKFHNIERKNPLRIQKEDNHFFLYENEYGTVFYHEPLFNGLELLSFKAKYFFINTAFLTKENIKDALEGNLKVTNDQGFLYQETIYKLK